MVHAMFRLRERKPADAALRSNIRKIAAMRNGFAEKTSETRHSRRLDGRLRLWPSAHIVGQPATKGLPQRLSVNGAVCGDWCLQDDGSAAGGFECQCTADLNADRKSTPLNSSHIYATRMPVCARIKK